MRRLFTVILQNLLPLIYAFSAKFGDGLERHIHHEYSDEMSLKSKVVSVLCDKLGVLSILNLSLTLKVPLGIILKCEQKYEEMVDILDSLHQYVPIVTTTEKTVLPGSQDTVDITSDKVHSIALGTNDNYFSITSTIHFYSLLM